MALVPLITLVVAYVVSPHLRANAGHALAGVMKFASFTVPAEPSHERFLMIEAADLMWQQRWDEALEIYEELKALNPDSPDVWYGLALCRHNLGQYDEAIEANIKALEAPGHAPTAWYHLAGEYALTGRTEEAIDALYKGMQLGYRDFDRLTRDPALQPLRQDARLDLPPAPEIRTFTTSDGTNIPYALVLPKDYDPSRTYPALLGFSRSRQNMNAANFALDNYWGLQSYYQGWIVISPLAPITGDYAYSDAYLLIPELLDDVQDRFRIEGDRFHLAGFSNGGTAGFRLATTYPERFHSITTFPCYEIPDDAYARLGALRGMSVSLFYGDQDDGPSVETSQRIQQRLIELGIDSTLTVFPGELHVVTSLMGRQLLAHLEARRIHGAPGEQEIHVGP